MTTGAALSRGEGLSDEASNGNGSLMRIIPLAFLPEVTDDEIREVSALTHDTAFQKAPASPISISPGNFYREDP